MKSTIDKLVEHVEIDWLTGCWIWTGATVVSRSGKRYGRVRVGKKMQLVHRVAHELFNQCELRGECDHTCEETLCFNPDHTRDMTPSENRWNHSRNPYTKRFREQAVTVARIDTSDDDVDLLELYA